MNKSSKTDYSGFHVIDLHVSLQRYGDTKNLSIIKLPKDRPCVKIYLIVFFFFIDFTDENIGIEFCLFFFFFFGLVSLFNGLSCFVGYLMPKAFLLKKNSNKIWAIVLGEVDKSAHHFLKGISST